MELIVKPTDKCNFNCDFCAASSLKCDTLTSIDQLADVIDAIHPSNIIFTGGEPTMVSPDFYSALLDEYPEICVDITTNLRNLMANADKWSDVITNKNFKVTASFNYNNARKMSNGKPYDEITFRVDMIEFSYIAGYTPNFISVMTEKEDYSFAKKTCELARSLGTLCRVNGVNRIGRSTTGMPRWKMLEIYMKLIDDNLGKYEINCIERGMGKCPMNGNLMCSNHIRAIYFKDGKLHWANCEEKLNLGITHEGIDWINSLYPVDSPYKPECLFCSMNRICNACYINKCTLTEDACKNMKRISEKVLEYGWKA